MYYICKSKVKCSILMENISILNKKTTYHKDGKLIKTNIFKKINIMEYKNKELTLIDLFDHIGEAKLYSYILIACNNNPENYYLHHDKSAQTIAKDLGIAPPTQFKYLALLVKKELLFKEVGKRGYYKINTKYLS